MKIVKKVNFYHKIRKYDPPILKILIQTADTTHHQIKRSIFTKAKNLDSEIKTPFVRSGSRA